MNSPQNQPRQDSTAATPATPESLGGRGIGFECEGQDAVVPEVHGPARSWPVTRSPTCRFGHASGSQGDDGRIATSIVPVGRTSFD